MQTTHLLAIVFASCGVAISCATVTGLDALTVGCVDNCDAGADAPVGDASVGDAPTVSPTTDGPNGGDVNPTPGGPPGSIRCGSATCTSGGLCCVRRGMGAIGCLNNCNPAKEFDVSCDTPDDCPGGVCCAGTAADGSVTAVKCAATCAAGVILCNPGPSTGCPSAMPSCVASRVPGYFECAP